MRTRLPRLSSAHVISLIALFVALGGTVYAAAGVNGKSIRKGSIPANRLKNDSLTGAQVNEDLLGTVPRATSATEALKAAEALKAVEASRAGKATEATKAVEATRATEAIKATKAVEATRATEAGKADEATRATEAGTAGDTTLFGGQPPSSYQHPCQLGAIKGVVRVNGKSNAEPVIVSAFNCSGGGVEVKRKLDGSGDPIPATYIVDFLGLDNLASALGSVIERETAVSIEGEGGGAFLVKTYRVNGTDAATDQFSVVVF